MKNKMAVTNSAEKENGLQASINIWLERIDKCYKDFESRVSQEAWCEILAEKVCVEDNDIASEQLLNYLMSHYRLPKPVWELMNECFMWKEKKQEFYQKYPKKFIDFVLTSIEEEDKVCYDQMKVGSGLSSEEIDEWIVTYYKLEVFYVLDDMQQLKETLDIMKHYDITYPRAEFIEQYYWDRMSDKFSNNKVSYGLNCKTNGGAYNPRKLGAQSHF